MERRIPKVKSQNESEVILRRKPVMLGRAGSIPAGEKFIKFLGGKK